MTFSELHNFYFKLLYFYDKLDLIIFADHLVDTKIYPNYEKYITKSDIKVSILESTKKKSITTQIIEPEQYNPFLMSSILKSSEDLVFNLQRLNAFLHKPKSASKDRGMKLEEVGIAKQLTNKRTRIRKVFANMLPIGHFFDMVNMIAVPKIYTADADPDVIGSVLPTVSIWTKIYDFSGKQQLANTVENDIIIGYYEKNPAGIDIKFKLRPPVHKIIIHEDSRMIERGAACNTKKKDELLAIAVQIGAESDTDTPLEDASIKIICNRIKIRLMQLRDAREA